MTHRPVEVDQCKRAASSRRRRRAILCSRVCVSVFDADLACPPTPRDPEIALSSCPCFCGRRTRPRPSKFTRPHPLLGRGPRCECVSAGLYCRPGGQAVYVNNRLRHYASNPEALECASSSATRRSWRIKSKPGRCIVAMSCSVTSFAASARFDPYGTNTAATCLRKCRGG
jgi:hypothetical protein